MNIDSRLKKLEQSLFGTDKGLIDKYSLVVSFTFTGEDSAVKKQQAIQDKISQVAKDLQITEEKAKVLFDKAEKHFINFRFAHPEQDKFY